VGYDSAVLSNTGCQDRGFCRGDWGWAIDCGRIYQDWFSGQGLLQGRLEVGYDYACNYWYWFSSQGLLGGNVICRYIGVKIPSCFFGIGVPGIVDKDGLYRTVVKAGVAMIAFNPFLPYRSTIDNAYFLRQAYFFANATTCAMGIRIIINPGIAVFS
jgi:hypothetical protein